MEDGQVVGEIVQTGQWKGVEVETVERTPDLVIDPGHEKIYSDDNLTVKLITDETIPKAIITDRGVPEEIKIGLKPGTGPDLLAFFQKLVDIVNGGSIWACIEGGESALSELTEINWNQPIKLVWKKKKEAGAVFLDNLFQLKEQAV